MRDSQRQKVYDAEQIAFRHDHVMQPKYDVGGIDGAQALVDRVFASATITEKYGVTIPAPTVVAGVGQRRRGCYWRGKNEIHLPEWTRQNWYVLHEIAHALVHDSIRGKEPSHGPKFAACYVELVRVYMGRRFSEALEAAFKTKRVTFKPKRAYTISDAERERRRAQARTLAEAKKIKRRGAAHIGDGLDDLRDLLRF